MNRNFEIGYIAFHAEQSGGPFFKDIFGAVIIDYVQIILVLINGADIVVVTKRLIA